MAFWKNDNGFLVWSEDRVLNENFELWASNKDNYEYPVEGWIWAETEVEARNLLVCYNPKPYPSWLLNLATARYEPPIPFPNDGNIYYWNEDTLSWIEIEDGI